MILLISFALVFGFVRPVIAAPFYVGSESMVPTLEVWDRVLEVPADHYFMMGDNRARSHDSRYFGPVPEGNLIGEALFRLWPPGRAGPP